MRPDAVLPEYPRPQLVRPRWQNLNGLWEFALLPDLPGTPATVPTTHTGATLAALPADAFAPGELPVGRPLEGRILVPFAPEAALSGVGQHADRVVYRRTFRRPADLAVGERLLLHLGACDWECRVVVNGRELVRHTGGYDAFTVDVTDALRADDAEQELVIGAYDPTDRFGQPRGKQVSSPEGIWYTPVTGIWQTVWLEPVPAASIADLRLTPDVAGGALGLTVTPRGVDAADGLRVRAVASAGGREVGQVEGAAAAPLRVPVPEARLWSPDDPFLYDLVVTLVDAGGREVDRVTSYFGMRSSSLVRDARGRARLALNGKPVFQLGPLDQGWWPDGLYTAPTDAALRWDVEETRRLGFAMTRKHIKVEPARWYYHADRLGLMVWQDMPSGWNDSPAARQHFERELRAMLDDLHDHPSIVTWVPFNEKWGQFDVPRIVALVRALDSSRTIDDVSGWQHEGVGDVVDVHRYQGPQAMAATAERAAVVGEFGGLGFKVDGHAWAGDAWGYGGLYPTRGALQERYELLARRMWDLERTHAMSAGVYTQLTDVEVELNGFHTYDRAEGKLDPVRTAAVNRGLAAYVQPELPDFTDTVRVSITTGRPGVEIRYTTNGAEPTAASPVYAGPFTLRSSAVVRARTFQGGQPTGAPEGRVDYVKGPGRAPAALSAVAAAALRPGVVRAYHPDSSREAVFRMNWPVRWILERPESRPDDPRPRAVTVAPTIGLAPTDTTELYGVRFTGWLRVPRTGVYTFTARSDDGAGLWFGTPVDSTAPGGPTGGFTNVFWSLGMSPTTTDTPGQIALQAGLHPFVLTYFQAYGPKALALWVEGPGMPAQPVPASWYRHDPAVARALAAGAAGPAPAAPMPVRKEGAPR